MWQRALFIAAGIVYLGVLVCALQSGPEPQAGSGGRGRWASSDIAIADNAPAHHPSAPMTDLPYRGVVIEITRVDWIDKYLHGIDRIADMGADTVLLVVDPRQENGSSSQIYLDMRMTPTMPQLGQLIDHAKKLNLRVILMPIVLLDHPKGDEWRGRLAPQSIEDWWDSYRAMMRFMATIAADHHVDVLVVGSELVSMEHLEGEWTTTIAEVRKIFHGALTYSSNWDHYASIPFWNQLDLIGMNSYWKLGNDHNVTVDEIQRNWEDIQKDLHDFQKKVGKPLLFLEVGWCSMANAAHEPWDYTKPESEVPVDLDLQKRLYEGFFRSWQGKSWLGGFMVWEWMPDSGGSEDRGYTFEGKPAEKVLREWLAKPRWKVNY